MNERKNKWRNNKINGYTFETLMSNSQELHVHLCFMKDYSNKKMHIIHVAYYIPVARGGFEGFERTPP